MTVRCPKASPIAIMELSLWSHLSRTDVTARGTAGTIPLSCSGYKADLYRLPWKRCTSRAAVLEVKIERKAKMEWVGWGGVEETERRK